MSRRARARPAAFWPWLVFAAGLLLAGAFLRQRAEPSAGEVAPAALPTTSAGDPATPPSPDSTSSGPVDLDNAITYRIGEGETIGSIARVFSLSPQDLAEANGISPFSPLRPGQTIVIPPPP